MIITEILARNARTARRTGERRRRFAGAPLLVTARRQRAGRGRSGTVWVDADRAVAASLAFTCHWPAADRPRLTLVADPVTPRYFAWHLLEQLGLLHPLAVMAGFTIIYGSILALGQDDLKKRLAYSTVSQLGILVMLIGQDTEIAFKAMDRVVTRAGRCAISRATLEAGRSDTNCPASGVCQYDQEKRERDESRSLPSGRLPPRRGRAVHE